MTGRNSNGRDLNLDNQIGSKAWYHKRLTDAKEDIPSTEQRNLHGRLFNWKWQIPFQYRIHAKGLKPGRNTNQLNQHIGATTYLQFTKSRCKEYWYGPRSRGLADWKHRCTSLAQVGTGKQSSCYLLTENRETVTDGGWILRHFNIRTTAIYSDRWDIARTNSSEELSRISSRF
jgi:hypothetical protein